ncbi:MAG: hypothetical protein KA248_02880 [Kiritimatiellae bacterium]|nr:hypothetical protein [Kiritimatiellia bacterium]
MAYLGVDIGSLFVGIVLVDESGELVRREYLRHQGEPLKCVRGLLEGFPVGEIRAIARTGSGGQAVPLPGPCLDSIVAGVEAARRLAPDARNILSIGGGSFSLTQLDETGHYRRSSINSACASGTGAFLDQQALRLQIPPAELAQCAMCYSGRPPGVATRCAVFAKSDMIHLQQEGFSVEAIAAGLCVGLGASTVDGLLDGRALIGKTLLIGGMARNSVVVGAIREKLGVETVVPSSPELAGAYGAALVARQQGAAASVPPDWLERLAPRAETSDAAAEALRAPLELTLSRYPDFTWHDHWINEDDSEVAIAAPRHGAVRVALGIDIGSTSTKATVLDERNGVVGWVYRKTAGNPIRAVQLVFKAFREMEKRGGFALDIRGVGTTGSGRKMIKEVIGADLAMNEITAHARAAVFIDPEVDSIIELGGQDAKFTQLQNGMVYNSVMNYVCAAGTGSFIEEQAHKLGIPLSEYAGRAMGKPCPRTSDRCTVYMERDLDLLMARGWSKDQIAAAVLHSVRDNYLNKVVGGLHIGDHIYFQGATARNKALVAAFEVELQKPIAVSPYCHLTGSLGMSLLARERVPEAARSARFKGLAFADEKVTVDREVCDLCHNLCNLSIIRAGQEVVAWGLKCGRDYGEKRMRVKDLTAYEFWKKRASAWANGVKPTAAPARGGARPRVGLLRSLGTYGYYPFWRAFLRELGAEVVYSPLSSEKILHRGGEITTAEYCAPVVMSHGHARALLEDSGVDYLFVPHMLREPVPEGFTDAHFCCYVQAHPGVLKSIEGLNLGPRLLAPVMDWSRPEEERVASVWRAVGEPLGVDAAAVRRALRAGESAQSAFREDGLALGRAALEKIERDNALGLVCFGRPYNTTDPGLTLDLPRKVAEMGYHVLYQDMLPFDMADILPAHSNMYWHYGQKILAAAEYVARSPRLFGVYFTNFMCGPDSYILTYFKEIMGRTGKPYLCLQFDGHGADAGYLTRIEAALESFHSWSKIPRPEVKEVNSEL